MVLRPIGVRVELMSILGQNAFRQLQALSKWHYDFAVAQC